MCSLFLRSRSALSLALLAGIVSFSPTSAQSTTKPRVALIINSLANEFFPTMEKGARDYQAQHAHQFQLISNGIQTETDVRAQINRDNHMNAPKGDAIVL